MPVMRKYYVTASEKYEGFNVLHLNECPSHNKSAPLEFIGSFYSLRHAAQYLNTHEETAIPCTDCIILEMEALLYEHNIHFRSVDSTSKKQE